MEKESNEAAKEAAVISFYRNTELFDFPNWKLFMWRWEWDGDPRQSFSLTSASMHLS
jgi:hypothetical protein